MKKSIFYLIIILMIISCQNDSEELNVVEACGYENPQEELAWLREIINKAEGDTTGNYMGSIYLEDNDVFWVEMAIGSGGLLGYWMDCEGNIVNSKYVSAEPKRDVLIYKNVP